MDLIFDTETTGFALFKSPASDPKQPHLVQLAVILADGPKLIQEWNTIVALPPDAVMNEGAEKVHGISVERSRSEGLPLLEVIKKFTAFLIRSDRVFCHNTKFDSTVIRAAYYRAGISDDYFNSTKQFCTMLSSKNPLKIPHPKGWNTYKWPTLQEAYKLLVDEDGFGSAHSADADTMACWKVLVELEKRNVKLI